MASDFAGLDWDRLSLRAGFWDKGRRPRDLLDLTPHEFRYLCLAPEEKTESSGWDALVLAAVVKKNEERGRRRERPKIPGAMKAVIEYRE